VGKDIPIIFSGPMVRALLEGRKTMTRRILKAEMPPAPAMDNVHPSNTPRHPAPYFDSYCGEREDSSNPRGMSRNWCWWTRDDRQCLPTVNVRYAPGDRLWVRENFLPFDRDHVIGGVRYAYGADTKPGSESDQIRKDYGYKWTPCIHMPRTLSRLTLVATGVKVERLQDISDADAIAEGVEVWRAGWSDNQAGLAMLRGIEAAEATRNGSTAQRLFYLLWRSLHGPDSWLANPFVVALTFRVIKANIDAPEARFAA
jgi:hypothetical protein